jgi:hypothetical protein
MADHYLGIWWHLMMIILGYNIGPAIPITLAAVGCALLILQKMSEKQTLGVNSGWPSTVASESR